MNIEKAEKISEALAELKQIKLSHFDNFNQTVYLATKFEGVLYSINGMENDALSKAMLEAAKMFFVKGEERVVGELRELGVEID